MMSTVIDEYGDICVHAKAPYGCSWSTSVYEALSKYCYYYCESLKHSKSNF